MACALLYQVTSNPVASERLIELIEFNQCIVFLIVNTDNR